MQRRISLELNLNKPPFLNCLPPIKSKPQIQSSYPLSLQPQQGDMIDEASQCSHLMNYSIDNLSEDLNKKVSVQEQPQQQEQFSKQPVMLRGALSEYTILKHMDEHEKRRLLKKNSKNSVETKQSSHFGEEILMDETFRYSLAQIILQKVEE